MSEETLKKLAELDEQEKALEAQAKVADQLDDIKYQKFKLVYDELDKKQKSANDLSTRASNVIGKKHGKVEIVVRVYDDEENPKAYDEDTVTIDKDCFGDREVMDLATHAVGRTGSLFVSKATKDKTIFANANRHMVQQMNTKPIQSMA